MRKFLTLLFLSLLVSVAAADPPQPKVDISFPNQSSAGPYFQKYEKELRQGIARDFSEAQKEGGIIRFPWSLEVKATQVYRGKFDAYQVTGYDYRGGAHGVPYQDALFFKKGSADWVPLKQLLAPNAFHVLSWLSREKLQAQGFDAKDEWMLRGTEAKAQNFALLIPQKDKVELIFRSYQIAPYAAGTPSVDLSWEQFRSLLRPEYR